MDVLDELEEFRKLSDIDRLQVRDVYDYLKKLKIHLHRAQTSYEIVSFFDGIISRGAVLKHLERLVSWKEIRRLKIKVGKYDCYFYEII